MALLDRNALISVYKKDNLDYFANSLIKLGYKLYSSGGTYKYLKDKLINTTLIEDLTSFPEILDGRVKTLHPKVHGGILYKRNSEVHQNQIKKHNIVGFDLVAIDLYPFKEGLKKKLTQEKQIELIDIGGPTMLRSAAKNFNDVIAVCDTKDYSSVIQKIKNNDCNLLYRKKLASKVFKLTHDYDLSIFNYMSEEKEVVSDSYSKIKELRYGENPHQKANLYLDIKSDGIWKNYKLHNGKTLSFNNIRDIESTWKICNEFVEEHVCITTKHSIPCGAGVGNTSLEAYTKAFECDKTSIFGGVVGFNKIVDKKTAIKLNETFLEVIIAPSYTKEAIDILKNKKSLRVIEFNSKINENYSKLFLDGALLIQERDKEIYSELKTVTIKKPSDDEIKQIVFGLKIVKHVKSNAIVIVQNGMAIGISGGQVNRFIAAKNAIKQSGGKGILISDGFFPFSDIVEECSKHDIKTIVQPGGSIRDKDSIEMSNKHNITMIFTGQRHFLH